MPNIAYMTFASIMRYFFVLAMIYILFRITVQSVREYISIRRAKYWVDGVFAATVKFIAPDEFLNASFELDKKNVIGSSKKCEIYIDGCNLKKKHAVIVQKKYGAFLKVMGNAVLNSEKLENGNVYPLHDGDKIQLNDVIFIFNTRLKEEDDA